MGFTGRGAPQAPPFSLSKEDAVSDGPGVARPSPRVISLGLTGGQAAGKSTALRFFAERGALPLSSDQIVSDLYGRPGVIREVLDRFGEGVAAGDGGLDRAALRKRTAGDAGALDWLEKQLHPRVGREIAEQIARASAGSIVVVEVPLLFEAGLEDAFDFVVTIEAPLEVRRRRASGREGSSLFEVLDERQLSSEARRAGADFVYVNDVCPEDMAQFVDQVIEQVRRESAG